MYVALSSASPPTSTPPPLASMDPRVVRKQNYSHLKRELRLELRCNRDQRQFPGMALA